MVWLEEMFLFLDVLLCFGTKQGYSCSFLQSYNIQQACCLTQGRTFGHRPAPNRSRRFVVVIGSPASPVMSFFSLFLL